MQKKAEIDPLKRFVEKESSDEEFSPMNPPDVYSPPSLVEISYEQYHPFIQKFIDEHQNTIRELEIFERTLKHILENGLASSRETGDSLKRFFSYFDNKIVIHNLKEEKILFPLLQEKLLINGEHSKTEFPKTAVDMLEDDHIKLIQLTSVCFNFFGLASRLPDEKSRALVLDAAIEQGKVIIENIRLHIFREDNVLFPLAHKYITAEEFDVMVNKLPEFEHD